MYIYYLALILIVKYTKKLNMGDGHAGRYSALLSYAAYTCTCTYQYCHHFDSLLAERVLVGGGVERAGCVDEQSLALLRDGAVPQTNLSARGRNIIQLTLPIIARYTYLPNKF